MTKVYPTDTTKACPYGVCDGSGHIPYIDKGYTFAKKCKCLDDQILSKKLEFALIPNEFRDLAIKDFEVTVYKEYSNVLKAQTAKQISQQYIAKFKRMKELGRGIYFYSATAGSGKTRLAVSIGNALIKYEKQTVRFITTPDLLGKIRDSWNDKSENSEDALVQEFVNVPVLILDDIGVEGNKDWINNIFYRIINSRLTGGRVTIITSNIPMDKLGFNHRLINRLEDMVMQVDMPEESIRSQKAKSKNSIMLQELLGGN